MSGVPVPMMGVFVGEGREAGMGVAEEGPEVVVGDFVAGGVYIEVRLQEIAGSFDVQAGDTERGETRETVQDRALDPSAAVVGEGVSGGVDGGVYFDALPD